MEEVSFVFRECYEAVRELSGRFGLAGGSEGGPSEDVLPEHRFLALSLRRGAHPCASEIGMASGLYLPGRDLLLKGNGLEMRLSGNLHIRKAVRRLQGEPVTLPDLWRELGIGSFLGEEARRKLELLYRKGYLRLF